MLLAAAQCHAGLPLRFSGRAVMIRGLGDLLRVGTVVRQVLRHASQLLRREIDADIGISQDVRPIVDVLLIQVRDGLIEIAQGASDIVLNRVVHRTMFSASSCAIYIIMASGVAVTRSPGGSLGKTVARRE
jgi:hypothetical protein